MKNTSQYTRIVRRWLSTDREVRKLARSRTFYALDAMNRARSVGLKGFQKLRENTGFSFGHDPHTPVVEIFNEPGERALVGHPMNCESHSDSLDSSRKKTGPSHGKPRSLQFWQDRPKRRNNGRCFPGPSSLGAKKKRPRFWTALSLDGDHFFFFFLSSVSSSFFTFFFFFRETFGTRTFAIPKTMESSDHRFKSWRRLMRSARVMTFRDLIAPARTLRLLSRVIFDDSGGRGNPVFACSPGDSTPRKTQDSIPSDKTFQVEIEPIFFRAV